MLLWTFMQTFLCRDKLLNLFVYPRLPWEFSIVVVFLRQDFIVYPKATLEFQTLLSQPPRAGIRHAPQAHQGSCLVSLWGFYIYLDCGVGGWGTHTCGGQVTTEGVISLLSLSVPGVKLRSQAGQRGLSPHPTSLLPVFLFSHFCFLCYSQVIIADSRSWKFRVVLSSKSLIVLESRCRSLIHMYVYVNEIE